MDTEKEIILVAEDSAPNRKILAHYLRMFGFEVVEAEDGAIGLKEYEKLMENPKFVAVFSDLMMPNLDGLGMLKEIRQLEILCDGQVPFVFISAVLDGEQVMEAMEFGISDYLLKPITLGAVVEKLNEIFPGRDYVVPEAMSA